MVECKFSKLETRVRFPPLAPAPVAQWIEQDGSNVKVGGPIPSWGTTSIFYCTVGDWGAWGFWGDCGVMLVWGGV